MNKNRISTISLILEVANEADDTKTVKIMYKVLLDHPQLKQYWKVLTEYGLVSYDFATRTFKITKKGQVS